MKTKQHCLFRGCGGEVAEPHFFCASHRDVWHSSPEAMAFVRKMSTFSEAIEDFNDRQAWGAATINVAPGVEHQHGPLTAFQAAVFVLLLLLLSAVMGVAASTVTP